MRDMSNKEIATNAPQVAFARYIAAHEEPPVDPVASIFNSAKFCDRYDARSGAMDAEVFRAELAERGLEIRPVSA